MVGCRLWGRTESDTTEAMQQHGVEGETGYTAQEDLKFLNSYKMGEGRMIGSGFSIPEFQGLPWFLFLFLSFVLWTPHFIVTSFFPVANFNKNI